MASEQETGPGRPLSASEKQAKARMQLRAECDKRQKRPRQGSCALSGRLHTASSPISRVQGWLGPMLAALPSGHAGAGGAVDHELDGRVADADAPAKRRRRKAGMWVGPPWATVLRHLPQKFAPPSAAGG